MYFASLNYVLRWRKIFPSIYTYTELNYLQDCVLALRKQREIYRLGAFLLPPDIVLTFTLFVVVVCYGEPFIQSQQGSDRGLAISGMVWYQSSQNYRVSGKKLTK